MPKNHDIIEIAGELRPGTDLAYKFFDGSRTVFLPKSIAEWDADSKTMQMPEWLALEKGLIRSTPQPPPCFSPFSGV
jgi:hypothetical protein